VAKRLGVDGLLISGEHLERKRSYCDNWIPSGKLFQLSSRIFESTSALVVHGDVKSKLAEGTYANWFP